jgi:chitooligosaccharide deacetylase
VLFFVLAGMAIVALAHTAPFPFLLEALKPSASVWHVRQAADEPPAIFLTFDDGPNAHWTPVLLDALAEAAARGTFFLIDEHVTPETTPVVRRIAEEGHAIGLHSGTRRLVLTEPEDLAGILAAAARRIEVITGVAPCRLFRPHAGWRGGNMYGGLDRAGYQLAGWSFGMWDFDWWRQPDGARVAARLARKATAGDIVVIHDGHHKNPRADRRHAAEAVRTLVPALRARGFSFATLC